MISKYSEICVFVYQMSIHFEWMIQYFYGHIIIILDENLSKHYNFHD